MRVRIPPEVLIYFAGVTEWNTSPPQKRGFEGSSPFSCTPCPGAKLENGHDSGSCALWGLRVRIPSRTLCCDAANGTGPVPLTGDPRKRTGGSSPSISAFRRSGRIGKCTCLLSRGRLVRHPGSGPGSGAQKKPHPSGRGYLFCKTYAGR